MQGLFSILETSKQQLGVPFFMEGIILISWSIWLARNDVISRNLPTIETSCFSFSKFEFPYVIHRAKSKYSPLRLVQLFPKPKGLEGIDWGF